MVILDYFVRLPALTAYVAYDKATALYFNWKQLFQGWGIQFIRRQIRCRQNLSYGD